MEKATGCSSLSVNIHQKKRVRFFLDTVGWEGGLLKLQSLPCLAGKVLLRSAVCLSARLA